MGINDDRKLRAFFDKRINQEVEGDVLGDEWKGYILKISGGNDKQGFPMMQGVMINHRVRLLLKKGSKTYRQRRTGERERKSVRGCITGPDLSVMNLVVVKKGEQELPGLTDTVLPRRLGPKRATRIRKLFGLDKKDDVRSHVVKRTIERGDGKKALTKAPKIQRLITATRLQRKRQLKAVKKARREASSRRRSSARNSSAQ